MWKQSRSTTWTTSGCTPAKQRTTNVSRRKATLMNTGHGHITDSRRRGTGGKRYQTEVSEPLAIVESPQEPRHPSRCNGQPTWDPVSTQFRGVPVRVFQNRIHRSAVPPPEARRPALRPHSNKTNPFRHEMMRQGRSKYQGSTESAWVNTGHSRRSNNTKWRMNPCAPCW